MLEAILIVGFYASCLGLGAVLIRRSFKTRSRGRLWGGLALIFGPPWLVLLYALCSEYFHDEAKVTMAFAGLYAVCVVVSAVYFRKFIKTSDRRALWTGLSLLFGPPGILILLVVVMAVLRDETPQQPDMMCYMPSVGGERGMIVQEQTDEDRARWGALPGKYSPRVSTETLHKLSGGIFEEKPSNVDGVLKPPGK